MQPLWLQRHSQSKFPLVSLRGYGLTASVPALGYLPIPLNHPVFVIAVPLLFRMSLVSLLSLDRASDVDRVVYRPAILFAFYARIHHRCLNSSHPLL